MDDEKIKLILKKILEKLLLNQIQQTAIINYYKDIVLQSFNIDLNNIEESIDNLNDQEKSKLTFHKHCLEEAKKSSVETAMAIGSSIAEILEMPEKLSMNHVMQKLNLNANDVYDKGELLGEKLIAEIQNQIN